MICCFFRLTTKENKPSWLALTRFQSPHRCDFIWAGNYLRCGVGGQGRGGKPEAVDRQNAVATQAKQNQVPNCMARCTGPADCSSLSFRSDNSSDVDGEDEFLAGEDSGKDKKKKKKKRKKGKKNGGVTSRKAGVRKRWMCCRNTHAVHRLCTHIHTQKKRYPFICMVQRSINQG